MGEKNYNNLEGTVTILNTRGQITKKIYNGKLGVGQLPAPKDHSKLGNLDYKNSGHTGFASAEEIEELKDKIDNISGKASDISYEDNYNLDLENVQEALDEALDMANNLEEKSIKELHNSNVDLLTLPVGIYYLTGTNTTIKYTSTKTVSGIITSDEQKALLIALGVYGSYGRGVMFSGLGTSSQTFLYAFGSGAYNNYNLTSLLTTSLSKTITGQFTFNTLPKSGVTPTASNHLTNKAYVDNRFREAEYATNLGYIDLADYDDDVFAFMDNLINEGRYYFIDSYDEFEWYVEVYRTDYYAGQSYWGSEEGFANKYYRHGFYNEDEDIVEWQDWTNFLTWDMADSTFASKTHVHYNEVNVPNIRTWLDEQKHMRKSEYEVIQTSDNHKFTVKFNSTNYVSNGENFYIRYQEYYDIEEPNKIYKRSGRASSNTILATITWGDWYVFEESSKLENMLKDILTAIQEGGIPSDTIEEIEQAIVSYLENKTVEEVET